MHIVKISVAFVFCAIFCVSVLSCCKQ